MAHLHSNGPRTDEQRADDNRRDAEWLRAQLISLSNYALLVGDVSIVDLRCGMIAIHSGRPWRGVLR